MLTITFQLSLQPQNKHNAVNWNGTCKTSEYQCQSPEESPRQLTFWRLNVIYLHKNIRIVPQREHRVPALKKYLLNPV
jgi:hypothetical protein